MNIDHSGATDNSYNLDSELIEAILDATAERNHGRLINRIKGLHAADIADLLEQISAVQRADLIELWGRDFDFDVLAELDDKIVDEVAALLTPRQISESVGELEPDDIVDIVEDLDEKRQDLFLDALQGHDQAAVQLSLAYPENTAGRLMQTHVVFVPDNWQVGEAVDALRSRSGLPEDFYHVILTNPKIVPVGQVSLGRLMASRREVFLSDIVEGDFRAIPVLQQQKEVAYAFNQYHLISAPVVHEDGRLAGVITIDDAMTVLDDEAEEDILRLAGVGNESLTDRVIGTTVQRFPWLIINLATAILASMVIALFTETIQEAVALAVLMPIVASMGGNAGTQSLTVAVRALATRDLTAANFFRVVCREALIGLWNGVAFAVIIGAVGYLWFGSQLLGLVLALAMIVNMFIANLSGILIPVGLQRARIDPAIASSVFVTTVTDVVGFFAFLGGASLLLF